MTKTTIMKQLSVLLIFLLLGFYSCKKEPAPEETITTEEVAPTSFTKRVLLEDYTKHCQYCIPVNALVDSLKDSYPNRTLIPVLHGVYHSTQISFYDSMDVYFPFSSFPKGMVNRTIATNSGSDDGKYIMTKESWITNIDSELLKKADFGLKISTKLSGNSLDIDVTTAGLKSDNNIKLTIFIVENNSFYRAVRKVVTQNLGDPISISKNELQTNIYSGVDIDGLSINKVSVVALLHYFNPSINEYEVLNVNETLAGNSVDWD